MVPKIFISPSLKKRVAAIEEVLKTQQFSNPHPDLLYIDDETKLGVETAKQIREFLIMKPYQAKGRLIAVESAEKFSPDAQNSLLKTLEEPPEECLILLGVDSENSLLPTILSRCELHTIYDDQEKNIENLSQEIPKLLALDIPARFDFIEKLDEKDDFLLQLIYFYQHKLTTNPQNLDQVKILLEAEKWHKANGNIRAILEYLMLVL